MTDTTEETSEECRRCGKPTYGREPHCRKHALESAKGEFSDE